MGRVNDNATMQFFEVRVRGTGHAAKVVGIQVEARNPECAAKRVQGNIISIRKIKKDDVAFDIERFNFMATNPPKPNLQPRDTYSEDWTLGDALRGK